MKEEKPKRTRKKKENCPVFFPFPTTLIHPGDDHTIFSKQLRKVKEKKESINGRNCDAQFDLSLSFSALHFVSLCAARGSTLVPGSGPEN